MNQSNIIFSLQNNKQIIISLKKYLYEYDYQSLADIFLVSKEQRLLLCDGPLYENVERLDELLKQTLNNSLPLDSSISEDIGFVYNQYCDSINNKATKVTSHFFCIKSGPIDYWIGDYYHLWAKKYVSWLYNQNGAIFFEITPFYPYSYSNPPREPNFIAYEEWIKTYQPLLIQILAPDRAQQWLDQAKYILNTINDNVQRHQQKNNL